MMKFVRKGMLALLIMVAIALPTAELVPTVPATAAQQLLVGKPGDPPPDGCIPGMKCKVVSWNS